MLEFVGGLWELQGESHYLCLGMPGMASRERDVDREGFEEQRDVFKISKIRRKANPMQRQQCVQGLKVFSHKKWRKGW